MLSLLWRFALTENLFCAYTVHSTNMHFSNIVLCSVKKKNTESSTTDSAIVISLKLLLGCRFGLFSDSKWLEKQFYSKLLGPDVIPYRYSITFNLCLLQVCCSQLKKREHRQKHRWRSQGLDGLAIYRPTYWELMTQDLNLCI